MTRNKLINLRNLFLFIKRYIFINKKKLSIEFGSVSATIIAILMFTAYNTNSYNSDILLSTFLPIFFLGGLIFTSSSFKELHDPKSSCSFLTFPISTLEKLTGLWLTTSVLFSVASIATIYIIHILVSILSSQLFDFQLQIDNIFVAELFKKVASYIVFQSIFLLGAIYFRKNNFLKTILSIFIVFTIYAILTGLAGRILFSDYVGNHGFSFNTDNVSPNIIFSLKNTISQILNFSYWYLTAPFFLIISYFRLKERQI
ncbi:MAG: hypothetical protein IMY72_10835 [Bacteroidetes bacterium]|nr:hypothetical protein [Bacteroidota bacterium]